MFLVSYKYSLDAAEQLFFYYWTRSVEMWFLALSTMPGSTLLWKMVVYLSVGVKVFKICQPNIYRPIEIYKATFMHYCNLVSTPMLSSIAHARWRIFSITPTNDPRSDEKHSILLDLFYLDLNFIHLVYGL